VQDRVLRRDIELSENQVSDNEIAENSCIYFIYEESALKL
jgi:hypothetical protein